MNSVEAKEILQRYRPGTTDEADPDVRAALAHASRDPELAAWLEEHCRQQKTIRRGMAGLKVPAGLREQILSEKRAHLRPWLTPRRALLGALAIVLAVVGLFLWMRPGVDEEAQFAIYRSRMVKAALRGYVMDVETSDPDELRGYLRGRRVDANWESPPGLKEAPLMGCAILTWRSQPATMICYGEGTKPELWLFVVDSRALPDPPTDSTPVAEVVNRLHTLSWTAAGRTYLLAGEKGETELRRLAGQPL